MFKTPVRLRSFVQSASLSLMAAAFMGFGSHAQAQTYSLANVWSQTNSSGAAYATNNLVGGSSDGGNRGMCYNAVSNVVFLAYRPGSYQYGIYAYDGTAGTLLGTTNGAVGSRGLSCDQIGCGDDGTLYGCPLNTGVSGSSAFIIYSWTNWANYGYYIAYKSTNSGTDPITTYLSGKRLGDTMCVTGSGTNTVILAGVYGINSWAIFTTSDGLDFTCAAVLTNSASLVSSQVYGLSFYTNNTFLVHPAASSSCYLLQYPTNFAALGASGRVSTTLLGTGTIPSPAFNYLSYSSAGQILEVFTNQSGSGTGISAGISLYSMTNFPASATLLANITYLTPYSYANGTGGAALGGVGKTNYAYGYDTDNALEAYKITYTVAPVAPTISSQPASVAIGSGAFAPQTVSVSAAGTSPLSYAWYVSATSNYSGTAISGATNSSYTIRTASTNYYYAVVTNVAGSVTSSIAVVATVRATTNSVVTGIMSVSTGNPAYPFLANDDNTRGMAYDPITQRLVVANKSSGAALYVLDANTGTNIGQLPTAGMNVSGGYFPVDQVVIAYDGAVYTGNLQLNSSYTFTLNRWSTVSTNTNNTPYVSLSGVDLGNFDNERWGDTMTIRGSGVNTQIALGSKSGTNIALLLTSDGMNFYNVLCPVSNAPPGFAALGIAFGAGNTIWGKTYLGNLYQVSFDPTGATAGTVLYSYTAGSQFPSHIVGLGVDATNNILGGVDLTDYNPDLQLFQLTGSSNAPVLFDQAFFGSYNPSANGNDIAVVDMKYPRAYAMDVDLGIIGVTYGVPASTPPVIVTPPVATSAYAINYPVSLNIAVSGTLPLYYQWQYNTVSNQATAVNIPGANSPSYTISSPTTNQSGWYDVIVTNFGGGITSAPVYLTIVPPLTSPYVSNIWTLPGGSRSYLDGANLYGTRGLAYDTNTATVLVGSTLGSGSINVLNAADGSDDSSNIMINTSGLPSGTFTIDQLAVADDGALYVGNCAITALSNSFALTRYSSVSSSAFPTAAYSGDPGAGSGDRWGDTMAIRGSGTNTQILLGSYGQGDGGGTNVALLTTVDGQNFTALSIPVANVPSGFAGLGIAFGAGNTFWAKGTHYYDLRQVSFDPTGSNAPVVLEDYSSPTQTPIDFTGIGVDAANNLLVGTCFDNTPNDLEFYQLTGTTNAPVLYDQTFYGSANANYQYNAVAVVKYPYAFGLDVNNGLVAVKYTVPPPVITTITITATPTGSGLVLSWNSVAGRTYQVESTSTPKAVGTVWSNVGAPIVATGSTSSYTVSSLSGAGTYYRVVGH